MVATNASNTTHFIKHLESFQTARKESTNESHRSTVECSKNKTQAQILQKGIFPDSTPYDKESRRGRKAKAAVTIYICKDLVPVSAVKKKMYNSVCR